MSFLHLSKSKAFFSVGPNQVNLQPCLFLLNSLSASIQFSLFLELTVTALFSFLHMYFRLKAKFFPCLTLYVCFLMRPLQEASTSFVQDVSLTHSHLSFTRIVSFPKRNQRYQVETFTQSGQSHQLPFVLPYPSFPL